MRTYSSYEEKVKFANAKGPSEGGDEVLAELMIQARAHKVALTKRIDQVMKEIQKGIDEMGEEMNWTESRQFPRSGAQIVVTAAHTTTSYPVAGVRAKMAESRAVRKHMDAIAKTTTKPTKFIIKKF